MVVEVVVDPYTDGQPIAPVLVLIGEAIPELIQLPFVRMMQAKELSFLLSWKTSHAPFAFSQTLIVGVHRKSYHPYDV